MRRTLPIGRLFGTTLEMHASFPLALVWLLVLARDLGLGVAALAQALVLFVFAVVCLVLHELGHVLVARRYGIGTHAIVLLPIGAASRLEREPEEPGVELRVALAGPAVNGALATVAVLLELLRVGALDLRALVDPRLAGLSGIWIQLYWTNVFIALLNLIPALPLDGGRILRALVAPRLAARATPKLLATTGYATAGSFLALGWTFDPFFVVLAALVMVCARKGHVASHAAALEKVPTVAEAMTQAYERVRAEEAVLPLLDKVAGAAEQRDLLVLSADGALLGLLTRDDVLRGIRGGREETIVAAVMRPVTLWARPDEPLPEAVERMHKGGLSVLPVLAAEGGPLVGALVLGEALEHALNAAAQRAAIQELRREAAA